MSTAVHSVKVSFGEDIRRFSFEGFSFSNLEKDLHLVYQLPPTTQLSIKFQDDESEWITVSSDLELANAFELFPTRPLRITFSLNKEQPALPIVETIAIPSVQPFPLYPMIQLPSLPMEVVQPSQTVPDLKCDAKLERRQKSGKEKLGNLIRNWRKGLINTNLPCKFLLKYLGI